MNPKVFLKNIQHETGSDDGLGYDEIWECFWKISAVRWGGMAGSIPLKDEGFFAKYIACADEPMTAIMGWCGAMWEEFTYGDSFIKDMYITYWAWTPLARWW